MYEFKMHEFTSSDHPPLHSDSEQWVQRSSKLEVRWSVEKDRQLFRPSEKTK